jgi:uncharacterized protein (DUF433 family)
MTLSLNLPNDLQKQIEKYTSNQGISFEQFVIWALAEKIGVLSQFNDDLNFPNIVYQKGVSGQNIAKIKNTGIRVQTIIIASQKWGLSVEQIAQEYDLTTKQIEEALAFYKIHQEELDHNIIQEQSLEKYHV